MYSHTGYEFELSKLHQAEIRQNCSLNILASNLNSTNQEEITDSKTGFSRHARVVALRRYILPGAFICLLALLLLGSSPASAYVLTNEAASARLTDGLNNNPILNGETTYQKQDRGLAAGTYTAWVTYRDIPAMLRQEYPSARTYPGKWELQLTA